MKKHLKVLLALFRVSAVADLELRFNFLLKIASDLVFYVTQVCVFETIFSHAPKIAGWTVDGARVFMGALFLVDSIWMTLFSPNFERLSDRIRKGDLDLLLAKPVNSQFMVSFNRISVAFLFNAVLALAWLVWAVARLPTAPSALQLLLFTVSIPCGVAISYSLRFFFSASALFIGRADAIAYVWYQVYRLGARPDGLYPIWLRYLILSVLPVAFIGSVPARFLLEPPNVWMLASSIFLAVALVFASSLFWKAGLRRYSSASS